MGGPIYYTEGFHNHFLYEYADGASFERRSPTRLWTIPYSFRGTDHLVYGGAFFFHRIGTRQIVRYDLATNQTVERELPAAMIKGVVSLEKVLF